MPDIFKMKLLLLLFISFSVFGNNLIYPSLKSDHNTFFGVLLQMYFSNKFCSISSKRLNMKYAN